MKEENELNKSRENRTLLIVVSFLCLLIIVPLLLVGIYNRPSADDYSYAIQTHQAVQNGGGFIEIIKAAWKTNVSFYHSWQGLYSSAFLLSLQPGIFGESFYSLTTPIIMLFAFVCIFISTSILNKHYFHYSRLFTITASLFILTFISLLLPSINQGLYWFNGAVNYMPWAFTNLLCVSLLVEIYKSNSKIKSICLIAITIVLSFLTSGGNHVTSFANILLLFFSLIIVWTKKKRCYPLYPLLSACIGFAIMYFAPGTSIRQAALSQQSVTKTIVYAAIYFFRILGSWISFAFILSLLLFAPVAVRFSKENPSRNSCIFPWRPLLLSAITICGMLCVPFYAMGSFGAGRVTNVIWITFIMLGWVNYFLVFRWAYEKHIISVKAVDYSNKKFLKKLIPIALIMLIVFLGQNGSFSSSLYAMFELRNGSAKSYGAEMDARFESLNNDSSSDIVVEEIQTKSGLLYFDDVTTDPTDWRNTSMSKYYGKKSIVKLPNGTE